MYEMSDFMYIIKTTPLITPEGKIYGFHPSQTGGT
jgi:hypothetical protein